MFDLLNLNLDNLKFNGQCLWIFIFSGLGFVRVNNAKAKALSEFQLELVRLQ
jgi:hypothetical protein